MSSFSVYKSNESVYIQAWKKRVSQIQLIKFLPNTKTNLFQHLNKTVEGRVCLVNLEKIRSFSIAKDNISFLLAVDTTCKHLEMYPTLIPIFPMQILSNLKFLRTFANTKKMKNTLYLTKDHKINCAACNKPIKGNEACMSKCVCSTLFFHTPCFNAYHEKCKICSFTFEY